MRDNTIEMNALSYKIKETFDIINCNGIEGSLDAISSLYGYILSHTNELKNVGLFQITGSILAEIAYAKIKRFGRIPHMAYYCFTQGRSAIEPVGNLDLILENQFKSAEGRLKLMFRGGGELISNRVHLIGNRTPQEAYELSHICDYLTLIKRGYSNVERWWQLAKEDVGNARKKYSKYSDEELILIGNEINDIIAERVLKDLHTHAIDYGYIEP
ncbi:MAG: hypothetical protein K2N35_07550 [Muribaculaceae bacterium]|nr:hypothetical protein [Muribaculaceae bacterium]